MDTHFSESNRKKARRVELREEVIRVQAKQGLLADILRAMVDAGIRMPDGFGAILGRIKNAIQSEHQKLKAECDDFNSTS